MKAIHSGPVQSHRRTAPKLGPIIDVTVPLSDKTPIYPGNPVVKFTWAESMDNGDDCSVSHLDTGAHNGTHVDAPRHFIKGAQTIDKVPLDKLVGPCLVIDCGPDARLIDAAELQRHPEWKTADRIIFKTRNSYDHLYDDPQFHADFTALDPGAAALLSDKKLVGIDYCSIEPFGAREPLTHRALLGHGVPVVEGLDLRDVDAGMYQITCLPASLAGREAAPARVILQHLG